MHLKRLGLGLIGVLAAGLLALPAAAQDDAAPIIDGLLNPRGIAYGEDGSLFIGEGGTGGPFNVQGPFGPALAGATGQIRVVSPAGETSVLLAGFPSFNSSGEVTGPTLALPHDGLLWVVNSAAWPGTPLTRTVLGIDLTTLRIVHLIDTFAAETEQNPDGNEIDSNPVDLAVGPDGGLYIADAGANTIWRWTADAAALEVVATWPDNPVPTSVAFDADGNLYVGFLMGFPFPEDGARVEVWSPAGELVTTYSGLTSVVDVLVHDGDVYAVEFATFGEMGWNPNTGSVQRLTEAGNEAVADGLNVPYGIAVNPAGEIVIAVNTAYQAEEGAGAVVLLSSAGAAPAAEAEAVPEPAETPGS